MICIIPARGGSKRIPRKNIKDFNGKPIILYTIDTCIDSNIFDKVIVSTDDLEIASIAGKTDIYIRSKENSTDTSTTMDAIEETIINCNITQDICIVYPCNPLLQVTDLQGANNIFSNHDIDMLTFIMKYSHPIQRAFHIDSNGHLVYNERKYSNTRTQDLEVYYHDAGMCYFMDINKRNDINRKCVGYVIDNKYGIDIDTLEDWAYAELKYKLMKGV